MVSRSWLPCGSYGAGSPTAVVCSRELVSCGDGGTLRRSWVDTHGHVSSVCTLDHFTCAPSSYRAFQGGKAYYFPHEFWFHWVFRIFLGFQHLSVTTDSKCLARVNARQQQYYGPNTMGFRIICRGVIWYATEVSEASSPRGSRDKKIRPGLWWQDTARIYERVERDDRYGSPLCVSCVTSLWRQGTCSFFCVCFESLRLVRLCMLYYTLCSLLAASGHATWLPSTCYTASVKNKQDTPAPPRSCGAGHVWRNILPNIEYYNEAKAYLRLETPTPGRLSVWKLSGKNRQQEKFGENVDHNNIIIRTKKGSAV